MNPNEFPELRSFFNEKEQIIAMPAKRKKLLLAVYYLSDKNRVRPGLYGIGD